jgi:hypothetical protein
VGNPIAVHKPSPSVQNTDSKQQNRVLARTEFRAGVSVKEGDDRGSSYLSYVRSPHQTFQNAASKKCVKIQEKRY